MKNELPAGTSLVTSLGRLIHLWPHPDEYDDMIALAQESGSLCLERGNGQVIYFFCDLTPGRSGEGMVYVLDKAMLGKDNDKYHLEVIDWVFREFELRRLQSVVPMPMVQARRFSERLGFNHEGILKNYGFMNGQPCDSWIGSMVK